LAGWPEFSLTTVAQPKGLLGRMAIEMLLARMAGKKVETRLVEPSLLVRGSTGPVSRS
jgi:DNA-binding LacI/PurR family transcriptional regulator